MALCLLRLDARACSVQRLPAQLVTTPQTVHSFTRESSTEWLARSVRLRCYACATMALRAGRATSAGSGGAGLGQAGDAVAAPDVRT
jgi:hypothetical protein